MVVAPALDLASSKSPSLPRRNGPARNSPGCDASRARAFCRGGFVVLDPSLNVGTARCRAVRLCQGAQVPSIGDRTSPSNNRWRGP
jgi:hypothetical protein